MDPLWIIRQIITGSSAKLPGVSTGGRHCWVREDDRAVDSAIFPIYCQYMTRVNSSGPAAVPEDCRHEPKIDGLMLENTKPMRRSMLSFFKCGRELS